MLYVNEKFLLTRLTSFMLGDDIYKPLVDEKGIAYKNFLDTLYYYLKFRRCASDRTHVARFSRGSYYL